MRDVVSLENIFILNWLSKERVTKVQKIVIVSNRLPVSITKRKNKISYKPSPGGLATGMSSVPYEGIWIGWPGFVTSLDAEKKYVREILKEKNMHPVFLSKEDIEKYYEGFSNKTIWPLFHYFSQYTIYNQSLWESYRKVNEIFCDKVLQVLRPGDTIWIHDYHLLLLPKMIRDQVPDATIGFFLHIPFPSFEIFRSLPWRVDILKGMLGSDLIGFHTFDYVRHFNSAVIRIMGLEQNFGKLTHKNRIVRIDSFPMGIDYDKFYYSSTIPAVKKEIVKNKKIIGEKKIILSIDRLDYSKGILQRLKAFHLFLQKYPEFRERVTLIIVAVPSRSNVETYRRLKHDLDERVGWINGQYGTIGWTPIWYLYRSYSFNGLTALYSIADVAMITPFRDGMNLIAKEFVATKNVGKGVLVLSEMAGAASELGEAIIINPNNIDEIVDALKRAFEIPEEEQIQHIQAMQKRLKRYNVKRWAEDFFHRLIQTKELQSGMLTKYVNNEIRKDIISDYGNSSNRLIFFDYEGTLVPFSRSPDEARPDPELLNSLLQLSTIDNNQIIIAGRDKNTIDKWLGHLNIGLMAEHGAWVRERGRSWQTSNGLAQGWKKDIRPLLDLYVERTPASLIEEKDFSLVWHYRQTDVGLGESRARELVDTLMHLTSNLDIQILERSKFIEVKNLGISKGKAATQWMAKSSWDFILTIGDDWTDEDLFKVMPEKVHTIKVGFGATAAKHYFKSYKEVRSLLKEMV